MSDRNESALSCYFSIEIDGIENGKFFRCEGLEAETYIYEVEEGGLNTGTHKFFGRTRYPNLVLDLGVGDGHELFKWYHSTVTEDQAVDRKDGSIIMHNQAGDEIKRWNFYRGIPCRWVGPKLGTDMRGVALERIEIAHEGIQIG